MTIKQIQGPIFSPFQYFLGEIPFFKKFVTYYFVWVSDFIPNLDKTSDPIFKL